MLRNEMDKVVDILLNSREFIKWETEGTVFWILLALFFCLLYYSLKMPREDRVCHSLYVSMLCAGIVFLYTGMTGEVFWFLNIKKVGLIMIFALAFTAILFGAAIGNTWGNLKNVSRISSDFKFGFWSLIVSLAWGVTLIRLVLIVFEEHPNIMYSFCFGFYG